MRRLSLKTRLLLIVAGVLLSGLAGAAVIILHNAREATLEEIEANLDFSQQLVRFLMADLDRPLAPQTLAMLSEAFEDLRHVQVEVENDAGDWIRLTSRPPVEPAPAWFQHLIVPHKQDFDTIRMAESGPLARIRISARTGDEVAEVWRDVYDLFWLAVWLMATVCVLTWLGLWLGLKPLRDLHAGFARLAAGDFGRPVRVPAVPELADTQNKFNRVLETLRESTRQRRLLTQKLVTMQEEERRAIAREMHDEMAPYLFGIRTDLQALSWALERDDADGAAARIDAVQDNVGRLQQRVRRLLARLRPAVLDDFGLCESLGFLVEDWQQRCPDMTWSIETRGLADDLDDAVQVTLYRAVQECLTNAARHAEATQVRVTLVQRGAAQEAWIEVEVADDGRGIAADRGPGLGLTGVEERVTALGGRFEVDSSPGGGTVLRFAVPARSAA